MGSEFVDGDYAYEVNGGVATITGYRGSGGVISIPSTLGPYAVKVIGDESFRECRTLTSVSIPNGVTTIGDRTFIHCKSLNKATIPDSVSSIGEGAFYQCSSLVSISLSSGLTSIGESAFKNCTSLASIEIPKNVSSIGQYAFSWCNSMIAINVDADNRYYTSVGGVLYDKSIKSLIQCPGGMSGAFAVPDGITTICDSAFLQCCSITSLAVPESVTLIEESALNMLGHIQRPLLTSIEVAEGNPNYASLEGVLYDKSRTKLMNYPGGRTGAFSIPVGVRSIESGAFFSCVLLSSVSIGSNVISIGRSAFSYCVGLKFVCIRNGVKSLGFAAFNECTSLTSLTIPGSVTDIGEMAFFGCSSLVSIIFSGPFPPPRIAQDWVEKTNPDLRGHAYQDKRFPPAGYEIQGLEMGQPLELSSEGEYQYSIDDGVVTIQRYRGSGAAVIIPASLGGCPVGAIGNMAFIWRTSMRSLCVPEGVTHIGDRAFYECKSLRSIHLPSTVASIEEGAFQSCPSLESIYVTVTGGNYSSQDGILYDKDGVTLIKCPPGRAGAYLMPRTVEAIGEYALASCSGLNAIEVDAENSSYASVDGVLFDKRIQRLVKYPAGRKGGYNVPMGVTSIECMAFYECTYLTSVTLPDTVTQIGGKAFWRCYELSSVTLSRRLISIKNGAFYFCRSLKSVVIPASVRSIMFEAFASCTAMVSIKVEPGNQKYTSIHGVLYDRKVESLLQYPAGRAGRFVIPKSVVEIGIGAFRSCSLLTAVGLPKELKKIQKWAFHYCTSLTSLTIPAQVEYIGERVFEDCESLSAIRFMGSHAPEVAMNWLDDTSSSLRGQAPGGSEFSGPGEVWNGLRMGDPLKLEPGHFPFNRTEGMEFEDEYVKFLIQTYFHRAILSQVAATDLSDLTEDMDFEVKDLVKRVCNGQ